MRTEVIMPKVGLDMEEGSVTSWFKKVGDPIQKGELLMEIETDKASTEIESNVTGVIVEILIEENVFVPIGTTIAWIETND